MWSSKLAYFYSLGHAKDINSYVCSTLYII
nr:MAG TPA: hypothetical protein [Caudoviricetes sp.]